MELFAGTARLGCSRLVFSGAVRRHSEVGMQQARIYWSCSPAHPGWDAAGSYLVELFAGTPKLGCSRLVFSGAVRRHSEVGMQQARI